MAGWRNGRRWRLKISWSNDRAGSNPALATKLRNENVPKNHLTTFKKFARELGINLSKWELENDNSTNDIGKICRELSYRHKINEEYSMYAIVGRHIESSVWKVLEFNIMSDENE